MSDTDPQVTSSDDDADKVLKELANNLDPFDPFSEEDPPPDYLNGDNQAGLPEGDDDSFAEDDLLAHLFEGLDPLDDVLEEHIPDDWLAKKRKKDNKNKR